MKILFFLLFIIGGFSIYQFMIPPFSDSREIFFSQESSTVSLVLSGTEFPLQFERGLTIAEVIHRSGFMLTESDQLYPTGDNIAFPGTRILWQPARTLKIVADGKEASVKVTAPTVSEVLREAGVSLDEDDLIVPPLEAAISADEKITVTRVEIKEEIKETKIPFVTKTEEDDKLSWRTKIVKEKGESGLKRTTYKVSYHNGKEVNRKTLSTETVKEPVTEIVTQGTLVKTGKAHRGAASWYAWTGTMAAANPWLPKGSYVKVTNIDNGKSVIVVINDRGPFVPGRIIDLDKVAFEKIASLGAGVINVKMEEITN